MEIRIEEVNMQPESGGWFSSVWGLPGCALGWFGRTFDLAVLTPSIWNQQIIPKCKRGA
ncbi:MAG: hypothetical protein LBF42_03870 [Puniceicoccales bacterium]|jgi:hypothetical protein|nr:hypothetical protein [Puniceicoccales bacterium]